MRRQFLSVAFASAALVAAACAHAPPPDTNASLSAEAETTKVRIAEPEQPVKPGDCAEATRRALAKPDLDVDQLPAPVAQKPAALQKVPKTALRKDGSAEIKVDVLIDTLGKADMSTFKVVAASNQWLASNVKSVIPKWTFSPALLAGCKVPRVYHFMASAPARSKSSKSGK